MHKILPQRLCPLTAVLVNMLLLFVAYGVTRLAFMLENYHLFSHIIGSSKACDIILGGLYFDASAIAYTNALYLLLVLLPFHYKENVVWQRLCRYLYIGVNGLALAINLADSVYYQYTARRTTIAFFSEFGADDKLGSIVGYEFLRHWYLVLLFIALLAFLSYAYKTPVIKTSPRYRYYTWQVLSLLIAALLCWGGMRGGFWDNRPIKISTANQFIIKPNDASLILNTPFSMLRTIGKKAYHRTDYFSSDDELQQVFSPIITPSDSIGVKQPNKKNIVVIFLESFGREYFGFYNHDILPGYKGYTEFLDSLATHSVTFRYSYSNGRASIDAMPSALCGLPMMVESFVAGPYASNRLEGLPSYLQTLGYQTAFFHGAPASSLGFQGFCHSIGFQSCYSQEDFESDKRTEGKAANDNWWGIWDGPFLQYFRIKMNEMKQPFMTTLFTLTSHHPFHVPEQYKERFKEEELPIHKSIRYTDNALRNFFRAASREPWYKNTVFILTGDHTNMSNHTEYKSPINQFSTSLIIYDPSGQLQSGMRDGIAQHSDILPTVLNLVGYDKTYMAFGCDLFNTPANNTWAVNYLDGTYQYCKYGYVLQFDGERTIGIYQLTDYNMRHNLLNKVSIQQQMERELKAVIQQYTNRMIGNHLQP